MQESNSCECSRLVARSHPPVHTFTLMYLLKADKLFVLNSLSFFFHSDRKRTCLQIHVLLFLSDIHMNLNVVYSFGTSCHLSLHFSSLHIFTNIK